jgi:DNA anti-recombination protein RmuC
MAMEGSLQEILARLLAGQQEMNARHERTDVRQEKANAEMKASQERANAEMKVSQEMANAEVKALQAEIKATYAEMEARAKARHEEAAARQEEANAELNAAMHSMRSDIERSLHQQMGALLEGSRSFGTRTAIFRVPPATCQTETSYPEEMDATRLESTLEETEAAVERQELLKEETYFDSIGSS